MPQSTTAMNTVDAVIEASADGATWTNISGSTNKIEAPSQTADIGSAATLEGQYKITTSGKFNPVELSITILYTETANEAFALLYQQANLPGRPLYLRYTPGGYNGEDRFYTANSNGQEAAGKIISMPYPGADAETAGPTLLNFTLLTSRLGKEHHAPSPSASVSPSASSSA